MDLWTRHPDALVLADDGLVVDANPSAERLFGCRRHRLLGARTDVLIPSGVLDGESDRPPLFRATGDDGRSFLAHPSIVPLAAPDRRQLIVIRDLTALAEWFDVDARERAVALSRESLMQHLFGAGLALRSSVDDTVPGPGRQRVERAIAVLDDVLDDLR